MLAETSGPRCGFLSTYPPTQCGLASFTRSLRGAVAHAIGAERTGVVRVIDRPDGAEPPEVVYEHTLGSYESRRRAVEALNSFDVVFVQHEYGIYGGPDGEEVLDILGQLTVPTIVVLHTILPDPSPNQRRIVEELGLCADVLVTMTRAAMRRLLAVYKVDHDRVLVIPHGAHDHRGRHDPNERPMILTWGLLGPGKGVESAIEAVAMLGDLEKQPRYVVAGQTHPKVRERSGESYRLALACRAAQLGVGSRVVLEDGYRDLASLGRLIRSADVVLLPYDSREQVTSGVLIEAVTAARPVVATAFPHAVELLSSGAGLVVPHEDPAAMAEALRRVLIEDGLADAMCREANRIAPHMLWSAVAQQYLSVARRLVSKGSIAVA